jgi:hypothetical protein
MWVRMPAASTPSGLVTVVVAPWMAELESPGAAGSWAYHRPLSGSCWTPTPVRFFVRNVSPVPTPLPYWTTVSPTFTSPRSVGPPHVGIDGSTRCSASEGISTRPKSLPMSSPSRACRA